jgi:hypothetical protein
LRTHQLSRHARHITAWIVIGLTLLACNMVQLPIPQQVISSTTVLPLPHSLTLTVTPPSETGTDVTGGDATPDVRTQAPRTVEVILSAAADSPSEVFFTLWKGAQGTSGGDFFMVNLYPGQQQSIYLLPGDYHYSANAPIPTQPLGCYNITESYGWSDGGNFTVAQDKIEITAKLGFILLFCTPTPGG